MVNTHLRVPTAAVRCTLLSELAYSKRLVYTKRSKDAYLEIAYREEDKRKLIMAKLREIITL